MLIITVLLLCFAMSCQKKAIPDSSEEKPPTNSEQAIAQFNLADQYMAMGFIDSALVHFKYTVSLDPEYILAYYRISQIYQMSGDLDNAYITLESLLKRHPELAEVQTAIKDLTVLMEKPKLSVQMPPRTAESDTSSDPRYFYNQALMLVQKQKYREAIIDFKQALLLNPDYLNAIIGLGVMYQNLSDYSLAIEQYKHALELDPDHGGTHYNMAVACFMMKQYPLAIEHADRAQALGFRVQQSFLDELSQYR